MNFTSEELEAYLLFQEELLQEEFKGRGSKARGI